MDAKHCNKLELYVLNILEVQGFEQPVSLDFNSQLCLVDQEVYWMLLVLFEIRVITS